jgi:hypothetical protein
MREFDLLVQFCMAHLIRDVKFLLTLPGREDRAYGPRVRDALRDLFAVIHRREKITVAKFQKALEAAREQVLKAATTRVPDTKHARNLAKRFCENGEAYFRFITTPGIGPTSNLTSRLPRSCMRRLRVARTQHLQELSAAEIAAAILEFAPKHAHNKPKWLAVVEVNFQKDNPSLQSLVVDQVDAVRRDIPHTACQRLSQPVDGAAGASETRDPRRLIERQPRLGLTVSALGCRIHGAW